MMKRFLPVPVSRDVKAEQIRILYHQGPSILALGMLTSIVAVAMFWNVANHAMLSLWLAIQITFSLMRLTAIAIFNKRKIIKHHTLELWGLGYALSAFVSALIWGSLSLFLDFWPAPYLIMLFAIYTGIIAGAFNTYSSYFAAFVVFYFPLTLCISYMTLKQTGDGFFELTTLFIIYVILMYVSALKFHNRLAHSLEIRFENEHLAEQLEASNQRLAYLADMDELTGICNRRSMDRFLSNEWNRLYRTKKPLSLLFLDIDFFKQYNDSYGHAAGDVCLIRVANMLHHHAQRSSDMAARFGGEEFAVILPETNENIALKIAEAIRANLESLQIPHSSSTIADHVTMSVGVATMIPNKPDNGHLLRLAADKALYQAKNMGRNLVIQADSVQPETTKHKEKASGPSTSVHE